MNSGSMRQLAWTVVAVTLAACGGAATVTRTLNETGGESFDNILVIAVAHDYNGRAMMERALVSRIRGAGSSATAYYRVVGNNPAVDRNRVIKEVQAGNFDSVLLIRVKDQEVNPGIHSGTAEVKATAKGGNPFNFFRYDYEEFDEPETIDLNRTVVLTAELYSAASEQQVWAVETTSRDKSTIDELVESSAGAIVDTMRRNGLVGD